MPTALERAQQQEARTLARAGLDPNGNPLKKPGEAGYVAPNPDDEDDEDIDDPPGNGGGGGGGGGGDPEAEELRRQIEKLQQDLAAANNRAAPEQQRAQEMRDLWQGSERARLAAEQEAQQRIADLQAQLDARRPAFDITTVLSEEERGAFDESTLNAIVKISEGIAKAYVPKVDARGETLKVLEEREATRVDNYRKKVLTDPTRGLHQLAQLSYDPAFQAWSQEDDNDMESVVTSLLHAKTTEDVDRFSKIVAKRIAKFKERTNPPTDPNRSLDNGMRRKGKDRMTPAETQARLNEATRLARSRNPADRAKAQQILNDLK